MIALEEGDAPKAGSECAEAEGLLRAGNPWAWTQLWRVEAELALDAGRIAGGGAIGTPYARPGRPPWAAGTVLDAMGGHSHDRLSQAGLLDEAHALVEHLDGVTERVPCRWPRSVAESGRAGLAEAEGDPERAEAHYDRAVELLEGIDLPLRRACALLFMGGSSAAPAVRFVLERHWPALWRKRGVWGHEACFPAASRAAGGWGPAPAGQLGGAERGGAQRRPDGGTGLHKRGDRYKPFHIGQDRRASPDVGILEAWVHSRKDLRARWKSQELPQLS